MASADESPRGSKKTAGSKGMKRCRHCGAKNKDSFEYCVRCSESLEDAGAWGADGGGRSPTLTLVSAAFVAILVMFAIALVTRSSDDTPLASAASSPITQPPVADLQSRAEPILEGVDTEDVMVSFEEGLRAYNQGDYAVAIPLFREVARELPDNPRAHQYLGLALYHDGDLAAAKKPLKVAHELRPDSFQLLDNYVTACKQDGDIPAAMAVIQDFVDDNPDELEARLELVRLARSTGNTELATEQAAILASEDEEDPEYIYEYGVSLKEAGKIDEAREVLETSVALDPDSAVAHHALGVTELLSGDAGEAVESLEEAVARDPENGDYRFSLAQAYEKLQRVPESLAAYDAYLEHARPDDTRAAVVRKQLEIAKKAWAREQDRRRESGEG